MPNDVTLPPDSMLDHAGAVQDEQEFVLLTLDDQHLGIPVNQVDDVLRAQSITPIPLAPSDVVGVINLRGRVITAVDLRTRLGLAPMPRHAKLRHVVVTVEDEHYSLMVDDVQDVVSLPLDRMKPTPANLPTDWKHFCRGMFELEDCLMVVLNLTELLGLSEEASDDAAVNLG